MNKVTPGKAMKEAMAKSHMKQTDIAEKLKVNQSSVSGNINRKKVGADVLITMMNAMGYSIMVGEKDGDTFIPLWELEKDEE